MKGNALLILCSLFSFLAVEVAADPFAVRMTGRPEGVVTTARVTVGDLAEVTAAEPSDDEAAIAVRRLVVREVLAPGAVLTVSADELLRLLERSGVSTRQVGYSLPRTMTVRRVGRTPDPKEVLAAIQKMIISQGRSAEVEDVSFDSAAMIDIDTVELRASPLASSSPGQITSQIIAIDGTGTEQRFEARARLQEWRDVPTAARPLSRGTIVHEEDLQMARMNLSALPLDTMPRMQSIVGLQASRDISFGEVIRKSKVVIPPIVTSGSRVTMVYRSGPLELTASGTALDSAPPGGEVKVRNDLSKRVISGIATEEGIVMVSTER
jgi:flagella basal body P-ring formation protein FlgA